MGTAVTTKVNGKHFGVNGGGGMVGDDVAITIDLELVSPVPAKWSDLWNSGKCRQEQQIQKSASQNRERPSEIGGSN
jgi:hypothetical protein